jgi:hypothetical protein
MRLPRRVLPVVLANKRNEMGQDCWRLARGSRGCLKPHGHKARRCKKLSPVGPAWITELALMRSSTEERKNANCTGRNFKY